MCRFKNNSGHGKIIANIYISIFANLKLWVLSLHLYKDIKPHRPTKS